MNPYADDYPLLSDDQLRLLLVPLRTKQSECAFGSGGAFKNKVTFVDISRETGVRKESLHRLLKGRSVKREADNHRFGSMSVINRRALSRFLLLVSCGMIQKVDGKIVRLSEPTKPMPVIRRVTLGLDGHIGTQVKPTPKPQTLARLRSRFGF